MKLTKKLLWSSFVMVFLVSMLAINVTSASPGTSFYVDPAAVSFPDEVFQIDIRVTEAPLSYAWEVHLSWDPGLLAMVEVTEGDFLARGMFSTVLASTPLAEANIGGEAIISCSLIGAVPMGYWASGDGLLVNIVFLVKAEGSCNLDLFDARLWDHLAGDPPYPAPTAYPSVDGFVETSAPVYSVDLAGWGLKVNGKAGLAEGGGHRTTVGEQNLLEALVENLGPRDVYVQVYFEIRDSTGVLIDIVMSNIYGPLAPEKKAKLTGLVPLPPPPHGWIAKHPGVYYVTAYMFYPIPGGFSRTFRLDAFW